MSYRSLRRRFPQGEHLRREGLPRWRPWFEHCETPYDLGMAHGKEDRSTGNEKRFRSGCFMTTEEYTDYRQGYRDGWSSEKGPEEF